MSLKAVTSLRINHHRSSSCSEYCNRVLNNHEDSPSPKTSQITNPTRIVGALEKSFDSNNDFEDSPALFKAKSTYEPTRLSGFRSTRPSTIILSRESLDDSVSVSTPEIPLDLDIFIQDDEEIHPKELAAPTESQLNISMEMAINEIIASANASVSYPCYVSVKPKEDYTPEQLGIDLSIIVDIKNHDLSSISNILDKFLNSFNEKDRVCLFATQNVHVKRFPLRVMQEVAKTEFINEFNLLTHLNSTNTVNPNIPLAQVLKIALASLKNRKYKNHVNAIFLITDRTKISHAINEIVPDSQENPLLFTIQIGQKQNSIELQELSEVFEGKYQNVESVENLHEILASYLLDLNYIRIKNVKLSFEIKSDKESEDILKISRVYEKNTLMEEEGNDSVEAHVNYFSMKEGIDIALEVEVCRCTQTLNNTQSPSTLSVTFVGDAVTQSSQITLHRQRDLNISNMHPLLRMMPKKIDKKALEGFYSVKVAKIVSYSVKMANNGYLKQSLQSLNNLKKELYPFTMLRSEAIQKMVKIIECTLNNLQSPSFRSKDKICALKGPNCMVGI